MRAFYINISKEIVIFYLLLKNVKRKKRHSLSILVHDWQLSITAVARLNMVETALYTFFNNGNISIEILLHTKKVVDFDII